MAVSGFTSFEGPYTQLRSSRWSLVRGDGDPFRPPWSLVS
jgi:hypothetical protein